MENALDKYCPLNPSEDQALLCSGESDKEKEVNSCFTISMEPFSISQTL